MSDSVRESNAAFLLLAQRDIATRYVIEWLDDPDQEHIKVEIRHVSKSYPRLPRDRTVQFLKSRAVRAFTPDGGFATPVGSRMGLLCRIIEAGMYLVDWDSVAEYAMNDQVEGGK